MLLSRCERDFLFQAIRNGKRLDGRGTHDFRRMKISFGKERGCVNAELGDTRVLVQVSCEITTPILSRPSEGRLFVNVEFSQIAAPGTDQNRISELVTELTRGLERCFKDSRAIDLESLCIISGSQVWAVRTDVHILNDDGNLIDCASIATITALSHFRRPDVSVTGDDITVFSFEEREPLPLAIHHKPLCFTFAFFDEGKYLLVDPTSKEEGVMDGKMVLALNPHREICSIQMSGGVLLRKEQVIKCASTGATKVKKIITLIEKALSRDSTMRQDSDSDLYGFFHTYLEDLDLIAELEPVKVEIEGVSIDTESKQKAVVTEEQTESDPVVVICPGTAELGRENGHNIWLDNSVLSDHEMQHSDHEMQHSDNEKPQATGDDQNLDAMSEEETTVQINSEDVSGIVNKNETKPPLSSTSMDLTTALKPKSRKKKLKATLVKKLKRK